MENNVHSTQLFNCYIGGGDAICGLPPAPAPAAPVKKAALAVPALPVPVVRPMGPSGRPAGGEVSEEVAGFVPVPCTLTLSSLSPLSNDVEEVAFNIPYAEEDAVLAAKCEVDVVR